MYGKGLYTIYDENIRSNTFSGAYGDWVYKLKINLQGFIIFDPDVCKIVYGKDMSPWQQLDALGLQAIKDELQKSYATSKKIDSDCTETKKKAIQGMKRGETPQPPSIFRRIKGLFGADYEVDAPAEKTVKFTSSDAVLVSDLLSKHVKGIVFTGEQDGKVAVVYDTASVVPVAWSMTMKPIRMGLYKDPKTDEMLKDVTWQPFDKESLKPAISRSAVGQFTPGRFNK